MLLINDEVITMIKKVFTLFKSADIAIFLQDGLVIGYNNEFSIMRTININPLGFDRPIYAIKNILSSKDCSFYLDDFITVSENNPIGANKMGYVKYMADCISSYNIISSITSGTPISIYRENDTELKNMITSMKASDGEIVYKLDNHHIMTLYTGILPITKSDIVNITIFDIVIQNDIKYFIAKFDIVKKTGIVTVYMKYLYV